MAASMELTHRLDRKSASPKSKKNKYSHIKEKAVLFLSSKENSNLLVELIECTQPTLLTTLLNLFYNFGLSLGLENIELGPLRLELMDLESDFDSSLMDLTTSVVVETRISETRGCRDPDQDRNSRPRLRPTRFLDFNKSNFYAFPKNIKANAFLTLHEEKGAVLSAVKALHQIFSTLLKNGAMALSKKSTDKADIEHKYRDWLRGMYKECIKCLAELISDESSARVVQELSVCTLMKLMENENHHPVVRTTGDYYFEQTVLSHLVPHLVTKQRDLKELLEQFQEYLEFDDLRFFLLSQLAGHLSGLVNRSMSQTELMFLCENTLALLEMVTMPTKDEDIQKFLGKAPDLEGDAKILSLREHKRAFGKAWLAFLKMKLPSQVYKKVLVILHDKVMPHMYSPILLTDFLTSSYDVGGAVSLLALNGLFILITKYNLEYPDFYKKLYSLFEPSVFHVKYKARFFHLVDIFLSSTHLPSYLVCAFIKRLSRLSLVAPPNALEYVIPFIINLFVRHPNCNILVHRTEGILDFNSDPYIHDEPDPAKSKATESCLWELETLQSHYHPGVASLAKRIHHPLPKMEQDLSEFLDLDVADLINKETQKKVGSVPLEFQPASKLFGGHEEKFSSDFWDWG
ncbi:Nucleolar complex protein 4-like [Holothuria leucospilota]|uniref:Nucleolar complex protein 4-like n=1 Tax=Holothuria leucospilota TaxID=206669 RepID=A0A9Q1CDX0_HOLLE|nr:Nucleolar complex protein 4-like [Holothuria leucospilota]